MKKIIILLIAISFNAYSSISIISDLDDTIKITNSANEVEATRNALFSDDVFAGMPEFLAEAKLYTSELHVLSLSSIVLMPKIQRTLKKQNIEVTSIILKKPFQGQSNLDYKVNELKKLFDKSGDDFILIGDDVDQDPEAYQEIKNLYPNRVLAVYIHAVVGRSLPRSSTQYVTAFDLAVREYMANRMSEAGVKKMVETLVSQEKVQEVFPDFALCPKTPELWLWQLKTPFKREAFTLSGKFNVYCLVRGSGI